MYYGGQMAPRCTGDSWLESVHQAPHMEAQKLECALEAAFNMTMGIITKQPLSLGPRGFRAGV